MLIEGRPGIGKTALIDRFLAEATGAKVVRANADESERTLTFGIADALLRSTPTPAPRGEDHVAVGRQLLQSWGELQGESPLVAVVDDVRWARQCVPRRSETRTDAVAFHPMASKTCVRIARPRADRCYR